MLNYSPLLSIPEPLDAASSRSGNMIGMGLYRLMQAAGPGRYGKRFRAWDMIEGSPVSVKCFNERAGSIDALAERLCPQIARTQANAHPAYIMPHLLIRFENAVLLVEEWLEGLSLLKLLKNRGSLPLSEAVPILSALASGVDAATERGIDAIDLTLRRVFLHLPSSSETPVADADLFQLRVHDWPDLHVKFTPLLVKESTRPLSPKRLFADIFYQTLGGHLQGPGSNLYVPLPQLSEGGNHHLKTFLSELEPPGNCAAILASVCAAESIACPFQSAPFTYDAAHLPARFQIKAQRIATLEEELRKLQEATAVEDPLASASEANTRPQPSPNLPQPPPPGPAKIRASGQWLLGSLAALLVAGIASYPLWKALIQPPTPTRAPEEDPLAVDNEEQIAAAYQSALSKAKELKESGDWKSLFDAFDTYQTFPGDDTGELRSLAEESIPALFTDLASAPAAGEVSSKSPRAKALAGEALAKLAEPRKKNTIYARQLFDYAQAIEQNPPNAKLKELASELARELAKKETLNSDENALLKSLAAFGAPEAIQLNERQLLAARQQEAKQEAWDSKESQMKASAANAQWLELLKLSDDPNHPDKADELDQFADQAARGILADLDRLPGPSDVAPLSAGAHNRLFKHFGESATKIDTFETLLAYLRWKQAVFPKASVPALEAQAQSALADAIASPNQENRQRLEALYELNIPGASEALEKTRALDHFQTTLAKVEALESNRQWDALFNAADTYLSEPFTTSQKAQLSKSLQTAANELYKNLDTLPPQTVARFSKEKKELILEALAHHAGLAVDKEDLANFRRYLDYQKAAFENNLPSNWQTLGARVVAIVKRDANRPLLEAFRDAGIDAATDALRDLDAADKRQQFLAERDRAIATARSESGVKDRLQAFLALIRPYYGNSAADWRKAHQNDINAALAQVSDIADAKNELEQLAKLGFSNAQSLLDKLNPPPPPVTEPKLTGLDYFRANFDKNRKNADFIKKYMKEALTQKSLQELEILALNALSIGMVDEGFSTLNGLYTKDRVKPSKDARQMLPAEFAKRADRATRTGWHGIWLYNGIPPLNQDLEEGRKKLQYAATNGHKISQDLCRAARIPY